MVDLFRQGCCSSVRQSTLTACRQLTNPRDQRDAHDAGAFLFPQMITPWESDKNWRPGFVDYLFLAFNTSTAFSPTDVPVLSRWAKLMMMMQALISLATVALLAARAVNIL